MGRDREMIPQAAPLPTAVRRVSVPHPETKALHQGKVDLFTLQKKSHQAVLLKQLSCVKPAPPKKPRNCRDVAQRPKDWSSKQDQHQPRG